MTDNIFNKPITGDIPRYTTATEQYDPADLVAALDAALAFPEIHSLRWEQYTPYFNDGDPCEFSIYELRVRLTEGEEDGGDYEDGYLTSWELTYTNADGVSPYRPEDIPLSDELIAAIKDAERAVAGGHHEVILNKLFGDPSQVTATREGFEVEGYDHD